MVRVSVKNISQSAIVAYVVVAERGERRIVWPGVYTGGNTLAVGKSITLGDLPIGSSTDQARVFVDYVRLADGSAWGDATTDQAKKIAARFQK
jgi:hypothetical protein